MKYLPLFFLFVSLVSSCDLTTERHCQPFQEKNVDSTFSGVGETVPPPVVEQEPTPPEGGDGTDDGDGSDSGNGSDGSNGSDGGNGTVIDTSPRSSGGGGLGTGAIVAMALGGVVLVAFAIATQRRKSPTDGDASASGVDSSAVDAA